MKVLSAIALLVMAGVAVFFLRGRFYRETTEAPQIEAKPEGVVAPLDLPVVENRAFAPGEKIYYNVIYKGITVGHSFIEVKEGEPVNNRPTLEYVSKTQSTKFFDSFFRVRDTNISIVDKASLFSVAFNQDLSEGQYKGFRHYTFDYQQRRFNASEKRRGKTKTKEGNLDQPFYDVLAAVYSARTRDLQPGHNLTLPIFRDNAGKPVSLQVDPEIKMLKTPLGKIPCLRVQPMIDDHSLFRDKGNKLVVWMTNDEKKLPVLIEATISVGLVRIKLDRWENAASAASGS